ncbi:unnamed protein product [Cuscuta epithymum]|uniref:Glutathione S-transferase n=1 Tax=Cuscuta epithymum TaxID=186058 RepID=A0AAV0D0Q6_9ASTE|nr:unnamed protein product [Cuscuta epithymum]
MASDQVKLLGAWWSPYVLRIRVLLNLKSIDYEFVEVQIKPKSELLLQLNPIYKKIPVLVHKDKPICESLVIIQYIEDVWTTSDSSLFPTDPYDRAMNRFWAVYIDDKIFPILSGLPAAANEGVEKEAIDNLVEAVFPLEDVFKNCSKGGKFFGGDKIGILDIVLGSFVGWFKANEVLNNVKLFDEIKFPNLSHWVDDFAAEEAVRDVLPSTDKLVEFAKAFFKSRTQAI